MRWRRFARRGRKTNRTPNKALATQLIDFARSFPQAN
jgi:hypothetical protein